MVVMEAAGNLPGGVVCPVAGEQSDQPTGPASNGGGCEGWAPAALGAIEELAQWENSTNETQGGARPRPGQGLQKLRWNLPGN